MKLKIFRRALSVMLLLGLCGAGVHLIFFEGWKDLVQGRAHRMGNEMFLVNANYGDYPEVTAAKIYLIHGEDELSAGERFSMTPGQESYPVFGSLDLTGKTLKDFLELWSRQEASYIRGAMCHGPVYGFRLFEGNRMVRETAICWSCSNFSFAVFPGTAITYGFHAESEQGTRLLEFCNTLLPYKVGREKSSATPPDSIK